MATINDALSAIADVVAGVTGIKKVDEPPTEQQSEYPFSVVYFQNGTIQAAPIGSKKNLFNVAIEVLTKKIKLQEDLAHVNPFLDSVPLALITEVAESGDQFNHTIQTFDRIATEFLPLYEYAGVPMIGYRFTLVDVKILVDL